MTARPVTWKTWVAGLVLLLGGWVAMRVMEPAPPVAPPVLSRKPGVRLFYRYECGKCHTLSVLPGASGTLGPRLDGVGQRAVSRVAGLTARDYLRQSLLRPSAYVVEGYLNAMPAYTNLTRAEQDELIDYLEKQ